MKTIIHAVVLCLALSATAAQPTYWWSQMIVKPDAKTSQEFFFVPGYGITFSYATNRVILNCSGTNIASATNAVYAGTATNWLGSNALYLLLSAGTNSASTNWLGSNSMWQALSGNPFNYLTNCCTNVGLTITQHYTDLVLGAVSNLFVNGLLVASGPYVAPHCSSLVLPGGGYLIQPNLGTLCLP